MIHNRSAAVPMHVCALGAMVATLASCVGAGGRGGGHTHSHTHHTHTESSAGSVFLFPADQPFERLRRRDTQHSPPHVNRHTETHPHPHTHTHTIPTRDRDQLIDICRRNPSPSLSHSSSSASSSSSSSSSSYSGKLKALSIGTTPGDAHPIGHVDIANASLIAGWTLDPDAPEVPIAVVISVDGVVWDQQLANGRRADVGAHAFGWLLPDVLGPPSSLHVIVVKALGVDKNGIPNGIDTVLAASDPLRNGSSAVIPGSCDVAPSNCGPAGTSGQCSIGAWCAGVPCYWQYRHIDTVYVENDKVRVGVNTAFGGTVFALHKVSDNRARSNSLLYNRNLILEHGGGAMQLSIWGYDTKGPAAWFREPNAQVPCDNTPYESDEDCIAGSHGINFSCVERCCSQGSHVLDCKHHFPCHGWTAGAPFNPIQAQGAGCFWNNHTGCSVVEWIGNDSKTLHTIQNSAYHFTSNSTRAHLMMEQWTSAADGFVNITYKMSPFEYNGIAWGNTTQEIPAIFTAAGVSAKWYWYNGTKPFTEGAVTEVLSCPQGFLQFPNRLIYPHATQAVGTVYEGWWGVCSEDESDCITVAGNSPYFSEVALSTSGESGADASAYITPIGYFSGLNEELDARWSVYVFPYKFDALVSSNKTVRGIISTLFQHS